jgi:hypothetical protein
MRFPADSNPVIAAMRIPLWADERQVLGGTFR